MLCEQSAKLLPTTYDYVYDYKGLYERMQSERSRFDRYKMDTGIRVQALFPAFQTVFPGLMFDNDVWPLDQLREQV